MHCMEVMIDIWDFATRFTSISIKYNHSMTLYNYVGFNIVIVYACLGCKDTFLSIVILRSRE